MIWLSVLGFVLLYLAVGVMYASLVIRLSSRNKPQETSDVLMMVGAMCVLFWPAVGVVTLWYLIGALAVRLSGAVKRGR